MSFADIPEQGDSQFKRTEYVKITAGMPLRLRILDKKAHHVQKYYIKAQRLSILALDAEVDPIYQNNQKLIRENPNATPRNIPGYFPRQNRYMVNVLNRTTVKITSTGNVVYAVGGQFPVNDPETGESLVNVEPQPLNRVQVLERGPQLFAQLNAVNDSNVDDTGNPKGLWTYDLTISATGSGRKMVTNIQSHSEMNDVVDVPEDELYNLESVSIQLEPSEMIQVVQGISLRDIYESRNDSGTEKLVTQAGEVSKDVKGKVDDLFKDS